ncbi:class I SAM-dependent methyltransferase [Roseomonas sp. E05]|uniref:methyltransferase domain-containing protein n=1 Tax=Roseomonas sp. E05 TaxID=3046310 RepID=UPI0024BB4053|nr:class I SAM-dependent methyltransferase [Roseomonas sp. E05]MDJ0389529.1 class I SAM-dependent methyltransferase [Roseomonas sp. E05]
MPDRPAAPPALLTEVSRRYATASRYTRHYVRAKLRRDPATAAILGLAAGESFGHVADLGCGRGQLALALLLGGAAERITGLDGNAAHLAEARQAAAGLVAHFAVADLLAAPVPDCDTVLLVDVLYQLPAPAQLALLARAAAAARRRIVIRAFDPARGWRSHFGLAMEAANRALRGARRTASIHPLPLAALAAPLAAAGFRVAARPCWTGTPLPNVLMLAERTDG